MLLEESEVPHWFGIKLLLLIVLVHPQWEQWVKLFSKPSLRFLDLWGHSVPRGSKCCSLFVICLCLQGCAESLHVHKMYHTYWQMGEHVQCSHMFNQTKHVKYIVSCAEENSYYNCWIHVRNYVTSFATTLWGKQGKHWCEICKYFFMNFTW